jgi:hypothetical protein
MYIGLEGSTGADLELETIRETEKAYFLRDNLGNEFWLPKSCFNGEGMLTDFGEKLYEEKRGL